MKSVQSYALVSLFIFCAVTVISIREPQKKGCIDLQCNVIVTVVIFTSHYCWWRNHGCNDYHIICAYICTSYQFWVSPTLKFTFGTCLVFWTTFIHLSAFLGLIWFILQWLAHCQQLQAIQKILRKCCDECSLPPLSFLLSGFQLAIELPFLSHD